MRKYSIVICAALVAALLVTYEPYKIEAIGCTYDVDPDTSSGVLEDYGWGDEVEIDMSKDMGSNTALWTCVHVSGELDKDKCGFAGINDGNRISGVISGANSPDWVYNVHGWVDGRVWVDSHYSDSSTVYLALHNVEYGFDTSETDPDYIQDEARIVREDTSDVCSAVRSPGEVVVTNKNYFSLWYKLYATAFAGTDRPELEVYSETTSTCAEGSLEAWDDYYGANPVPIDTLYFE